MRRLALPLALLGICLAAFGVSFGASRLLASDERSEFADDETPVVSEDIEPEVRSWLDPDRPLLLELDDLAPEDSGSNQPEITDSDGLDADQDHLDQADEDEADLLIEDPCDVEDVGEEYGEVLVVYRVVDSELGEICYGVASPVVENSWNALVEFTDKKSRSTLSLFAGIESFSVLAFAGPISDYSYDEFVIAVDVFAARVDPQELRLTLAHELGHVLTQADDQFDDALFKRNCDSFHNGFMCFHQSSYIGVWTEQFWSEEALSDLPSIGFDDQDAGDERCLADRTFLGSYAATHPEEDFAESFSAFVFSVEVPPSVQPRIDFFLAYPELVAFRDRAVAAGLIELANNFDLCG